MSIFDHIETVKGKPHHVKRRVAFGSAGAVSALVALVWFGVSFSSGAYALHDGNFAEVTGGTNVVHTTASAGLAAAAAANTSASASQPAHVEILDSTTTSSISNTHAAQDANARPDQTIIPF